jgi:poly(A) polymerase
MTTIAQKLADSPAVEAVRGAVGEGWIVGGAVRDAALARDVVDVDLAVREGEEETARALADRTGGPVFTLSEEFGTWRVLAADRAWHVDVTRLRGPGIEADLALRDFTVNAIAVPVDDPGAPPLDPHGGLDDLASRVLRAVSETSFEDDPLRVLRAARLASGLGFEIASDTVALARKEVARASEPAGERQFTELRLLITGPDPLAGLRLMDELGATAVVLPELEALRGIEQNPYHQHDVHGHTVEVLGRMLEVESDLEAYAGDRAAEVRAVLAEPLADELTRQGALRFAALFHDVGKPETRNVSDEGRVLFIGHDRSGARMVRELCERLRASRRLADYLANLTLNHLRLGFLVHARPLDRRAVYEYLRATEPDGICVTLLTVADRLATQGEKTSREAVDAHLELARQMISEALEWRRSGPPRSPIPGDELAAALGIEPGPELGRVIAEIEAAVFAGEVSTREDAIDLGRRVTESQ